MRKQRGYEAEKLVAEYYKEQGWNQKERNRTIRGGEIDIILENNTERCFIEVKCSNYLDEYGSLMTRKKRSVLKRAVWTYNSTHPTHKYLRIDVVFVRKNTIVHIFEKCLL